MAESFVHVSPLGRIEGRGNYLETVKQLVDGKYSSINIIKTFAESNQAVVFYNLEMPEGTRQACDWVFTEGGQIIEIRSFYDTDEKVYQNL